MVKLVLNNTYTQVIADPAGHNAIYWALSYVVENHEIIKRQMYRKTGNKYWKHWDGVKSFYNKRSKAFLTGLLTRVTMGLSSAGLNYEVADNRKSVGGPRCSFPNTYRLNDKKLGHIELFDYQIRACQDFLNAGGRGTARLATGAGKTECAIALTKFAAVPMLFMTHRVNLLYQTAQRFAERLPMYSNRIGVIGDSTWQPNFLTFATVQTLHGMAKKDPEQLASELAPFGFLVIDEAHRSGAEQFHLPAKCAVNAFYRLALTATPFMTECTQDDLYLMGTTGPVVASVTNGKLIERGILARPFFNFIEINAPTNLSWLKDWHDIYEHGIVKNEFRNKVIARKTAELIRMGKKPLVICQQVKHGNILKKLFTESKIKSRFISGTNAYTERKNALEQLSGGQIQTIIATNIFDEGIDVKDIDAVVMAAGNKSAPALFQRTGRATRRKETNNYAVIIDFIDRQHRTLLAHSTKRYGLVKNEPGFVILQNAA